MDDQIKVPLKITLSAGDVVIAEIEDARLASFVLNAALNPPDYSLPPLAAGFLHPGYRVLP